jgi:hypothetical protein
MPAVNEDNLSSALVAAFEDPEAAHRAVVALEQAGFPHDAVGFISPDGTGGARSTITTTAGAGLTPGGTIVDAPAHNARDALQGAITGGMVGGVLAAAVSILVPGIGPILAGGVLAAFFGGTLAGSAVGGLLGALRGLGLTEERAAEFERHVQAGKALVVVHPADRTPDAENILRAHGGFDLHVEPQPPLPAGNTLAGTPRY